MDKVALQNKYKDTEFLNRFQQIFNINIVLSSSIIKKDFKPTDKYVTAIALTEKGEALFNKLKADKFKGVDDQIIVLSIFLKFYHEELFVDIHKTNIDLLNKIVSQSIVNREIYFPWIYGRLLYDKYFDEFDEQEKTLGIDKVVKLLDNTYQGVFQIGNTTIGPLGIKYSCVKRIIPPTRKLKLWHCSDPSCLAFHDVHLESGKTEINQVSEYIHELYIGTKSSEWSDFNLNLIQNANYYYNPDRYDDIPMTIVNTFGNNEMKLITKSIIDSVTEIRQFLPNEKRYKGSSDQITTSMDKSEHFQLLLLCENKTIIETVEQLIANQLILIPNTEIRASKVKKRGGFYDISHQCNKLGFRSISYPSSLAIPRLKNLIVNIYQDPVLKQQLEWNLRYFVANSFEEKIDELIKNEDPKKIIKENVLNGPTQLNKAFELLYGHFRVPTNLAEESTLIDKILWKLGFDINIYPKFLSLFWDRLELLKNVTLEKTIYSEIDKDKIRSVAVNLFVSLEEILKHSLAFTTWLLLSDHYLVTKFRYNFEAARSFMTNTLNGHRIGSNDPLIFDKKGRDTLFPLIEGFYALFDYCEKLLIKGYTTFRRPEEQIPRFYGKTQLTEFPYLSTMFLFDIKPDNYHLYKSIALSIPNSFNQSNVLSLRNRLEHDREDFPTQGEIINASECIENTINQIEANGIYPNVYLYKSSEIDKYKRITYKFEDFKNRLITICPVADFTGCQFPTYPTPQIIIPIIKIGNSSEPLRIKYEENSEYLNYWSGFPRKKIIHERTTDLSATEINE